MDALFIAAVVVAAVVIVAWVLSYRASRIDRLHARVEGCWHALDAVFVRRSEAILELANAGVLDPASALLLTDAVSVVLAASDESRDVRIERENELADITTLVLAQAAPPALVEIDQELRDTVTQTVRQVSVAASFYNDSVSDVIAIRDQLITTVACLAGKAPRLHRSEIRDVDVTPLTAAALTGPAADPVGPAQAPAAAHVAPAAHEAPPSAR